MGRTLDACAERFVTEMRIRGCKQITITKARIGLRLFLEEFGRRRARSVRQIEVAKFLERVMASKYSEHSKQYIRRMVKALLRDARGARFASFIKVKQVWSSLHEGDLLGRDELTRLIENLPTLQYKAMASLLYDGALRRCELLGLRLNDLDLEHEPAHVTLHGKTEERTIPLTFSVSYLRAYLRAQHRLSHDSLLWSIGPVGLRKALKKAAVRAGVGKRVYPYLLRHSRLSELAGQNMRESLLKQYAGWTQDSPMPRNYVHLGSEELDRWVALTLQNRLKGQSAGARTAQHFRR